MEVLSFHFLWPKFRQRCKTVNIFPSPGASLMRSNTWPVLLPHRNPRRVHLGSVDTTKYLPFLSWYPGTHLNSTLNPAIKDPTACISGLHLRHSSVKSSYPSPFECSKGPQAKPLVVETSRNTHDLPPLPLAEELTPVDPRVVAPVVHTLVLLKAPEHLDAVDGGEVPR